MNIADLKKLAGITDFTGYKEFTIDSTINKREIERQENINPGTDDWFKLYFSSSSPALNMPLGFRGRKKS